MHLIIELHDLLLVFIIIYVSVWQCFLIKESFKLSKLVILVYIFFKFSVFSEVAPQKAVLKIIKVSTNSKLFSPQFDDVFLVKDNIKLRSWLSVEIKYEIKNNDKDDKSTNDLKITGDFVVPNLDGKKQDYYVFSKILSYPTVPRRGIFYAVFLINPRSIVNYFSSASILEKNLYGRLTFKVNGITLSKQTIYLSKGKTKSNADNYAKDKYASEIAPNISPIIITRSQSPWKNIQYDLFNQLDTK